MKRVIVFFCIIAALSMTACSNEKDEVILKTTEEPTIETSITPETVSESASENIADTVSDEEIAAETEAEPEVDMQLSDAEAAEKVEELLEKSLEIQYVILYAGLSVGDEVVDMENAQYSPVTDSRFATTEDVKNYILSVYTQDYYDSDPTLTGSTFTGDYAMYIDYEGKLYMNVSGGGGGGFEYAYGEMTFFKNEANFIEAKLPGQNSYGDLANCSVDLVVENGEWKIDAILQDYILD